MTVPRFHANTSPTIGVEVEIQIINPATLQLTSGIAELKRHTPEALDACVKPELMQSYVEINTGVCADTGAVRRDLAAKMRALRQSAEEAGFSVVWAGTHPTSHWDTQEVTDDDRYRRIIDQLQYVARRLVTFGVHVHVGMPNGETAIAVMNDIVRYVPHLLALSANSPFWYGRLSGLQSARIKALEALPRGGLPPVVDGWTGFSALFDTLCRANAIDSIKDLWWDMRPHPDFGTLEMRVFDTPLTFDEAVSMAALTQALVVRAMRDIADRRRPVALHPMIVAQNKWWATRYGLDAEFIANASGRKVPAREALGDLVDTLGPVARELGSLDDLNAITSTLARGTGASLQIAAFERTGTTADVVRFLLEQDSYGAGFDARHTLRAGAH